MGEVPRPEDVKEALAKWAWLNENGTERQAFEWALENDPLVITRIWEAARLWLASQEQTPNYQAAAKRIWHMSPVDQDWDYVMQTARLAVDAALGVHPQDEGEASCRFPSALPCPKHATHGGYCSEHAYINAPSASTHKQ